MGRMLDQINSPDDLKKFPVSDLPEIARELRDEILAVVGKTGGHLGASLGAVELTLSTASPALSAAAPGLAPFPVALMSGEQQQAPQVELSKQLQSIRGRQQTAIVQFRNTLDIADNIGSNWEANAAANPL